MDIKSLKVTVREVVTGYVDDSDRKEGIYVSFAAKENREGE